MIKANELRIGNYLIDRTFGNTAPTYVDAEWLVKISEGEFDADPIPLTPEILEKAGFEKSESDFWVKDGKPSFQWGEGNDEDWFITYQTQYGLDWNDAYHVRTLHQLQNLYFALTGEELEINF